MSFINMSNIDFDSKIFLDQVSNKTIPSKTDNSDNEEKFNFGEVLQNTIHKVNESQINANNDVEALIKGEDITMHEVMLSMQESQISMQLMLEMRNKLYDAYKELSSVQL